jgi:hypothetical protein
MGMFYIVRWKRKIANLRVPIANLILYRQRVQMQQAGFIKAWQTVLLWTWV